MTARRDAAAREDCPPGVDLYWLPLGSGAGGRCVRASGRLYETGAALRGHRTRTALFHSALIVHVDGSSFAIEMAPVWAGPDENRGVMGEGPVGLPVLGRFRLFRYEVRCWRDGTIPDLAAAVESPRRVSTDDATARRVLALVHDFPLATWGLDEQRAGEMWNSNSLTAWLLACSGHDVSHVAFSPPGGGRAPGWSAGVVVAGRAPDSGMPRTRRASAAYRRAVVGRKAVSPPCRSSCPS